MGEKNIPESAKNFFIFPVELRHALHYNKKEAFQRYLNRRDKE